MVKYLLALLFLLFLAAPRLMSQEKQISEKETELRTLKSEISSLQKELDKKNKKEKASFAAIEIFSRQEHLLNKMILRLKEEEGLKEKEIRSLEGVVENLRKEIKILQDNYARYVKSVYMYGKVPEWAAFVDAGSINQAMLRIEYLRRFSLKRKSDLDKLETSRAKLVASITRLEAEKKDKALLVQSKQEEEKVLNKKKGERMNLLTAIRNDKAELRKELKAKKNAQIVIEKLITRLVEEAEQKRREQAERLARLEKEKISGITGTGKIVKEPVKTEEESDVDLSTSSFSSFAAARGRLAWPLNGGTVYRKFGEYRNKKLNTVTMNNGIDIKAGKDVSVKSVAEGVISAVDWVPGYGSVIIVSHKGDFRTVYGNLSELFVKEGDKVKRGAVIAKIAQGAEGNILHFEIWNARVTQNPELWLTRH